MSHSIDSYEPKECPVKGCGHVHGFCEHTIPQRSTKVALDPSIEKMIRMLAEGFSLTFCYLKGQYLIEIQKQMAEDEIMELEVPGDTLGEAISNVFKQVYDYYE